MDCLKYFVMNCILIYIWLWVIICFVIIHLADFNNIYIVKRSEKERPMMAASYRKVNTYLIFTFPLLFTHVVTAREVHHLLLVHVCSLKSVLLHQIQTK